MSRPTEEDLALLARPTWRDAANGALYTWGIFTLAVATVTGAIPLAGGPSGLLFALLFFLFAAFIAGAVGGVVSMTWGFFTGMVIGRLLRPVRQWRAHALAYFGWGALTGLAVACAYGLTTTWNVGKGLTDPFFWLVAGAVMAITGLSTLAGWALAWRSAIRRSAGEAAALPLLAE